MAISHEARRCCVPKDTFGLDHDLQAYNPKSELTIR